MDSVYQDVYVVEILHDPLVITCSQGKTEYKDLSLILQNETNSYAFKDYSSFEYHATLKITSSQKFEAKLVKPMHIPENSSTITSASVQTIYCTWQHIFESPEIPVNIAWLLAAIGGIEVHGHIHFKYIIYSICYLEYCYCVDSDYTNTIVVRKFTAHIMNYAYREYFDNLVKKYSLVKQSVYDYIIWIQNNIPSVYIDAFLTGIPKRNIIIDGKIWDTRFYCTYRMDYATEVQNKSYKILDTKKSKIKIRVLYYDSIVHHNVEIHHEEIVSLFNDERIDILYICDKFILIIYNKQNIVYLPSSQALQFINCRNLIKFCLRNL